MSQAPTIHDRCARESEDKNASRPVSRVLFRLRGDDHSSGPYVAAWFSRPTRMHTHGRAVRLRALHPYSVLLPAGLAVPASLRSRRWALTPPFHPYPLKLPKERRRAVYSLWRYP